MKNMQKEKIEIVHVENLIKSYGKDESKVCAVNNVNLSVCKGEFLAIVGSSGSGKSTLLHMLGGLDIPTSGDVKINGESIFKFGSKKLTVFRRKHIGFVFQSFNLLPTLNVYENIVLPCELDGRCIDKKELEDILIKLNLKEKINEKISHLSGGQQQRVAIARALVTKPDIILADEPTGSLDSVNSFEVMDMFIAACKEYEQTVIMITHDEHMAQMANRIVRIEDGKLYEE